jgi:N-acetylglucosamine malate deacetylase 1
MSRSQKSKSRDTVLVVAAHPDDEVLGCGGTIARHAALGDAVYILILAEGQTSRDLSRSKASWQKPLEALQKSSQAAARVLGAKQVVFHRFPDNRMDSVVLLDIVKVVEKHIQMLQPTTIYTHHAGDVNVDHQQTHHAVVAACRPQPGHSVRSLLFFEVASSTEWRPAASGLPFVPNRFHDISKHLAKKLSALRAYHDEMRPWPHARSLRAIEALARWRGATVGVQAAEAFVVGREIQ